MLHLSWLLGSSSWMREEKRFFILGNDHRNRFSPPVHRPVCPEAQATVTENATATADVSFCRQITGEQAIALYTVDFLRSFIGMQECKTSGELLERVTEVAKELVRAQPYEFAIANISRRVLRMIREECRVVAASQKKSDAFAAVQDDFVPGDSFMYNMLANPPSPSSSTITQSSSEDFDLFPVGRRRAFFDLVQGVLQGIDELREEIVQSRANIAAQALEHIHSNEIIMTLGRSETVEQFLLTAGKKRQFQVMVAEAAPECHGHILAKNLAAAGISTLLITDAAIFAMMARVNKVILGCHSSTTLLTISLYYSYGKWRNDWDVGSADHGVCRKAPFDARRCPLRNVQAIAGFSRKLRLAQCPGEPRSGLSPVRCCFVADGSPQSLV